MAQENKNYYYDRNGYNTYGVRGTANAGGTTVEKFEMTETEGVTYSSSTGATIAGSAEINDTDSIDVELIVPIKAGEGLVVDADDQDESIEVHLDSTVTGKLGRALLTPVNTPANEQLVGVDTSNAQEMITIGSGLSLSGGTLSATGGGGGGGASISGGYTLTLEDLGGMGVLILGDLQGNYGWHKWTGYPMANQMTKVSMFVVLWSGNGVNDYSSQYGNIVKYDGTGTTAQSHRLTNGVLYYLTGDATIHAESD